MVGAERWGVPLFRGKRDALGCRATFVAGASRDWTLFPLFVVTNQTTHLATAMMAVVGFLGISTASPVPLVPGPSWDWRRALSRNYSHLGAQAGREMVTQASPAPAPRPGPTLREPPAETTAPGEPWRPLQTGAKSWNKHAPRVAPKGEKSHGPRPASSLPEPARLGSRKERPRAERPSPATGPRRAPGFAPSRAPEKAPL